MSDTEGTQLGSLHPFMLHPHAVLCVSESMDTGSHASRALLLGGNLVLMGA